MIVAAYKLQVVAIDDLRLLSCWVVYSFICWRSKVTSCKL